MRSNNKVKINVQLHNTQHYKQIVGFKEYKCTMYLCTCFLFACTGTRIDIYAIEKFRLRCKLYIKVLFVKT